MTTRIAIVDEERCKPDKCAKECKKSCPINLTGSECIKIEKKAIIYENLCTGCNICTKKCPFKAIEIIHIPNNLQKDTIHRFGLNGFKIHRLPIPKIGKILGLIGANGVGKSTALNILGGKIDPNFGKAEESFRWKDVLTYFRGTHLQDIFNNIANSTFNVVFKNQYVDALCTDVRYQNGTLFEILNTNDERKMTDQIIEVLELQNLKTRKISELSGGELQRFAIALTVIKEADMYIFDEPSSYLDIKQRLIVSNLIRNLITLNKYVIVVEHDLSVLDYLSDYICIFYGTPAKYGVATTPYSVREGINMFLDGYIPMEKLRFRKQTINFKLKENIEDEKLENVKTFQYPKMLKKYKDFSLQVEEGNYNTSEIIVILGSNGSGKTTFMKMLAGLETNDTGEILDKLNVSYKPQKITPKFDGTVQELLSAKLGNYLYDASFNTDVVIPLQINDLFNNKVKTLSGGELQRVGITLALGKPADIYLIDEPSAYLDSEQRIIVAKLIRRFILHQKKTAFVIEHDFLMSTYLADKVILFTGTPGVQCIAKTPQSLYTGMNNFLEDLNVTLRRDPCNHRPRINKLNSQKDKKQKKNKTFFFLEEIDDTPKASEIDLSEELF